MGFGISGRWPLKIWKRPIFLLGLWPAGERAGIVRRRWRKRQGKGERGKGKGKDMVGCANQSYIVRFAHGLWLSNVLKVVVRRRWLYFGGLDLYSRPHGDVNLCTRESVYSRPRAGNGVSAAFSFGCQKSGRKNLINIVYFLSSRYRPGPPRSWEGA